MIYLSFVVVSKQFIFITDTHFRKNNFVASFEYSFPLLSYNYFARRGLITCET